MDGHSPSSFEKAVSSHNRLSREASRSLIEAKALITVFIGTEVDIRLIARLTLIRSMARVPLEEHEEDPEVKQNAVSQ